jgi:hypothetical protein
MVDIISLLRMFRGVFYIFNGLEITFLTPENFKKDIAIRRPLSNLAELFEIKALALDYIFQGVTAPKSLSYLYTLYYGIRSYTVVFLLIRELSRKGEDQSSLTRNGTHAQLLGCVCC